MIRALRSKYSGFSQNDFIKSVATLATGTVISQVIPLLLAPLISRLYHPSDYAVLATYGAVTAMLTIISTGMFDAALMLDKDDASALNTGALALLITLGVTLLSLIIMLAFSGHIARFMGNADLGHWLYLVPMTIFFHGCYQTFNVWNNRKQRYKRLASNRIIMTAITTGLTLVLGYWGFHERGLIISLIAGQAISFVLLSAQTVMMDKLSFGQISFAGIRHSLQLHKDFPRYNMPQGFLDAFKESSLTWIISIYFGNVALGSFSFAKSIIMRPLQVIGSSVSQVFYQRASAIYNDTGNILSISKKTFTNLLLMGLPFALVVLLLGKAIFGIVFGSDWAGAGQFAQILILWLLLAFVGSAISSIPLILQKQKNYFLWSILMNLCPVLVLFLAAVSGGGMLLSMSLYSLTNVIFYLSIFAWIRMLLVTQARNGTKPPNIERT